MIEAYTSLLKGYVYTLSEKNYGRWTMSFDKKCRVRLKTSNKEKDSGNKEEK